jgi:hypothetical protein
VADPELLIRARVNGRESGIYEKVVVTGARASIAQEPGAKGNPIEPYAIFFKLRTPAGHGEQDGYVRIGDSTGTPLGWIARSHLTDWNTRFVLEPVSASDREFTVEDDSGQPLARQNTKTVPPAGTRRLALITRPPKDDHAEDVSYPVVVYTGRVQDQDQGGSIAQERNQLENLKLEIVFVLESTDFMLLRYDGPESPPLLDSVKELMREIVAAFRKDPRLQGAVRFGIVEYQDTTAKAKFRSRLTCPLVDDMDQFLAGLERLDPVELRDDWTDDVIAGLATAIRDARWSENSSKHVILIGASEAQRYEWGTGPNQYGIHANSYTAKWNRTPSADRSIIGYNSAGLTIPALIAQANPQSGTTVEVARNAKTFHTVLAGRELPKLPQELEALVEKVVQLDDDSLYRVYANLIEKFKDKETARELLNGMFGHHLFKHQRQLARQLHAELAHNNGVEGMRLEVEPTGEAVRKAVEQIKQTLEKSFQTLADVHEGRATASQIQAQQNPITERFYTLVGAAAERFRDDPTLAGFAHVLDDHGRETAQRKVLVSRNELIRLKSTLDAIYEKFQKRTSKEMRQNVSDIVDAMKSAIVGSVTGQEIAADVPLRDVISDLPLRTTALEMTPGQIAVMSSDTFTQWLNKLKSAQLRAKDLIDGKDTTWMVLSPQARNDQFTFLLLNELP